MADVSVTAANVAKGTDTAIEYGYLGATVTAGQTVYLDSSDGLYKLADSNASASTATVKGIALNGGSSGQPVAVAVGGHLNPGFTVGVGTPYFQSATAGGICPAADLTTGMRTTYIGTGKTASSLELKPHNSGTAIP